MKNQIGEHFEGERTAVLPETVSIKKD